MTVHNVIGTLSVEGNTVVTVNGRGDLFSNGMLVVDENGKTYEVISVVMTDGRSVENLLCNTTLLVRGSFFSKHICTIC